MRILHIIKKADDRFAHDTILQQKAGAGGHEVSVLLLHDAVCTPPLDHSRLFFCEDDAKARGLKGVGIAVNYRQIVRMLLEADSVVNW